MADVPESHGDLPPSSEEAEENGHRASPSDWSASLAEAAQDAEQLAARLADLARHPRATEEDGQLALLESRLERVEAKLRELRGIVAERGQPDNLGDLAALLDAWRQKPNDLLIMVKVAEKADRLSSLVRHYQQVATLVDEA